MVEAHPLPPSRSPTPIRRISISLCQSLSLSRGTLLPVLKSTGSAFENFIRDEHTTLAEVSDRIFSTAVDLQYTYTPLKVPKGALASPAADASAQVTAWDGDAVFASARAATVEVFAEDESASVQVRVCAWATIKTLAVVWLPLNILIRLLL